MPATPIRDLLREIADPQLKLEGWLAKLHAWPGWQTATKWSAEEIQTLPPPKWLVRGVLLVGQIHILYGLPKTGKTYMALDLVHSMGGRESGWHGHSTMPAKSMYFVAEGVSTIGARLRALEEEYGVPTPASASFVPGARMWFNQGEDAAFLQAIELIETERPDVIFVDTIFAHNPGAGLQNEEDMGKLFEVMRLISVHYGIAVVMVHHSPKSSKTPFGSVALWGNADQLIRIERVAPKSNTNKDVRIVVDGRVGEGGLLGSKWSLRPAHDDAIFVPVSRTMGPKQTAVLDFIRKSPDGVSTREVQAAVWPDADPGGSNAIQVLNKLITAKEIEHRKLGGEDIWFLG